MIALSLRIPRAAEDDAVTVLWELGTLGIETSEPAEDDRIVLLAYFPATSSPSTLTDAITAAVPAAETQQVQIPQVDWVARVREGFRAFDAAGFRIVPEWEASEAVDRRTLVVDPGRAFGLGTHESTQLCLQLLSEAAAQAPLRSVLDVGSGTGILSVAAVRLGASQVVACDIDPEAVSATRRHASLNHTRIDIVHADGARAFRAGACDTLLANITAPLLIERAPELMEAFRERAILAGLLEADVDEVRAAFAAIDPRPHVLTRGEWAALALRRDP